jgi:hypothetical protein
MKEPYDEGVATRIGLESCAVVREDEGEALTEGWAGRVWSRETLTQFRGVDPLGRRGRRRRPSRHRERRADPARSETPSTLTNTLHGTREISRVGPDRWHRGPRRESRRGARRR